MCTRGYEYNQIRICIHIIMGSQIPAYFIRGYSFNYSSRTYDGFTDTRGHSYFCHPYQQQSDVPLRKKKKR